MLAAAVPVQNTAFESTEHNDSCVICLNTLPVHDMTNIAAVRKCEHVFHRSCILGWKLARARRSQSCPICRGPLVLYSPLGISPTDRALVSIWKRIYRKFSEVKGTSQPQHNAPSIRKWMKDHQKSLEKITRLDLHNAQLCGVLPDEIGYFSNLGELILTGNDFCSFPKVLGKLPLLQDLAIEPKVLEGEEAYIVRKKIHSNKALTVIWEQIKKTNSKLMGSACNPIEIRKRLQDQEVIAQVTRLDLRDCSLVVLPPEIAHLKKIKNLQLTGNDFSHFPKVVEELPVLQELEIEAKQPVSIKTRVAANYALASIWDNLTKNYPKLSLPDLEDVMQMRKWIEGHLDKIGEVSALDLSDLNLVTLPEELRYFAGIKKLILRKNQLESLSREICELPNLQTLSIEENFLISMPESAKFRFLKTLVLSWEQCDFLLKYIRNFPVLRELQIGRMVFPFFLFTSIRVLQNRKIDSLVIKMILSLIRESYSKEHVELMVELLSQIEKPSAASEVPQAIIRGLIAHGFGDRTIEKMIDLFIEGMAEVFWKRKGNSNKEASRGEATLLVIEELLKQDYLERAIESAKTITDTIFKEEALARITKDPNVQAVDKLIAVSTMMSHKIDRRSALSDSAKRFALQGKADHAIALASAISCDTPEEILEVDLLFESLADILSSKQLIDPTMKALRAISDHSLQKRDLLFRIMDNWATEKLFTQAARIIELLSNPEDRKSARARIINPYILQLIKESQIEQAIEILETPLGETRLFLEESKA